MRGAPTDDVEDPPNPAGDEARSSDGDSMAADAIDGATVEDVGAEPAADADEATDDAPADVRPPPRVDARWFRHELTPTWLATATRLAGERPPDLGRPFRVAWLGCGGPATPAVVAAVHPHAEVVAWEVGVARVDLGGDVVGHTSETGSLCQA